jgi:Interferon-related developmental regulator (IFRD)
MAKKSRTSPPSRRSHQKTDNGDRGTASDSASVLVDHHHHDDGGLSESYTIADHADDSNSGIGNMSLFGNGNGSDDDDDDDDFNDRIIQRGDPGDEQAVLVTSNRLQYLREAIQCITELPHEKRTVKRELYLRRCYKVLSLYASCCGTSGYEMVSSHCDNLVEACLYALRPRQPSTEQYAACRLIEVVSIMLSNDADRMEHFMSSLHESLRRTIIAVSRATPVRMAALRALSVTTYMATISGASDNDGIAIESLQDICEALATNIEHRSYIVPLSLRATAYDCWSLLATVQDDWTISGQDDIFIGRGLAILPFLKVALDESKTEFAILRSSAGECLSLIHEAKINLGVDALVERDDDNDDSNCMKKKKEPVSMMNGTSRRYQKGSWEGTKYEILMDEVKQRIAELATQSCHHISKKDKKEQRASFREYMATIVDDESPELVINFRNNGNLTLSSWKEIIPLNFLRHSLQSGFQTQLLNNPTIQHLFHLHHSVVSNYSGSMSQLEKRLILSKTSDAYKSSDQERRKKRDKRENIKNHFLTADGDDI